MNRSGPHQIDIEFSQLIREYIQLGDLISKKTFGIYPGDCEKSMKEGFVSVGDGPDFRALEKECLVGFPSAALQVTVKPLFLRGAYVNTSFVIMPGKVKLAYLLALLVKEGGPLKVGNSRILFSGDIEEGAFVHRGLLVFRFRMSRKSYYLTTVETAYAANEASKRNAYFNAVVRSMDRLVSKSQLHEYMGADTHAVAALGELESYLPVVEESEIGE